MTRQPAAAAGLAVAALVAGAALLAWRGDSPLVPRNGGLPPAQGATAFLVLLALAYCAYLAGLALVPRGARSAAVLAIAVAVQVAPLAAPLVLSTDAWTYWSYGWLAAHGESPYATAPASRPDNPALPFMGADWRDTTTVYGPVFTLASEPVAGIAQGDEQTAAWLYKALAALAVLSATLLVGRLAERREIAMALVGWNPLLAIHAAGGGHNDAWVGALVVAALALERSARPRLGGLAWSTAVLVKWVPLPFLCLRLLSPAVARRGALAAGAAGSLAVLAGVASWRYGASWLDAAGPLADNAVRETRFAFPARLEQLGVPDTPALVLAGAMLATALALLARQALGGRPRPAAAACALLLTTPYLAVWYLLWAVPLAAAEEDDRTARVCCLALGAYLLPQTIPR